MKEISKLNGYKSGLANYANLMEKAFQASDENLMNEYVAYKEFLQNKYPKYKNISQAREEV